MFIALAPASHPYLPPPGPCLSSISPPGPWQEEHLVLANPSRPNLIEMKRALMAARRLAHPVLGWEVPAQALRFSKVLGSSCYGDIFQGRLDGQEVLIKTLKPDCGQAARDAFDRELSVLW